MFSDHQVPSLDTTPHSSTYTTPHSRLHIAQTENTSFPSSTSQSDPALESALLDTVSLASLFSDDDTEAFFKFDDTMVRVCQCASRGQDVKRAAYAMDLLLGVGSYAPICYMLGEWKQYAKVMRPSKGEAAIAWTSLLWPFIKKLDTSSAFSVRTE